MSIKSSLIVAVGAMMTCGLVACGSPRSEESAASPMAADSAVFRSQAVAAKAENVGASAPQARPAAMMTQRSIIRKAQLSVRVDSVEKAEKSIDRIVSGIGGYVDSAQSADLASTRPTIDLTLRVPVSQFDASLDKFEALGVRLSKTVNSEDVTGQLVDLDARLKTMAAQEETYRGLLKRANGLESVIQLQDKLTEVRSEIESMAAQRKTLGSLAALSTITVHLEQAATTAQPSTDPNWLAQVWGESTTTLGGFARGLATALVWLLVFSPLWIPFAIIARRGYRKYREDKNLPRSTAPPFARAD